MMVTQIEVLISNTLSGNLSGVAKRSTSKAKMSCFFFFLFSFSQLDAN